MQSDSRKAATSQSAKRHKQRAIRAGRQPKLPSVPDEAIGFISCPIHLCVSAEASATEAVLQLYRQDPESIQVHCARRTGLDGTGGINALHQSALTLDAKALKVWAHHHHAYAYVGTHLGDQMFLTHSLWDLSLQNGPLGIAVEVADWLRARLGGPGSGRAQAHHRG